MPALESATKVSQHCLPVSGSQSLDPESSEWTADRRREAVEQLIETYHADVFRYCFWLSHSRELAEDATQETFLRAFKGIHGLRDAQAAKGWVLRIARNEVIRTQTKTKGTTLDLDPEQTEAPQEGGIENVEWVQRGLQQLSPDFRLVLLLYYFEHLSYAEISTELDIPIGTVMSRINRGKSQLKQSLEQN
ncbi:MAG: RNA polymerase sigma factor [Planctomycetota bacterium]|nr:RNA polymerase sigma factor [Planctomycetota bacterium]